MSLVLHGLSRSVVAVWSWESAVEGRALELRDKLAALAWLRRVAAGAGAMAPLRRLAAQRLPLPSHPLDDSEVLDWLAGQIATGQLRLVARPLEVLASWGDREEIEPVASSAKRAVTELTWITIELLGEDDRPIPGERYRLELPDGSVHEGRLDSLGIARVRGIEQGGNGTVTFPDLDQEAWAPLRTTGVP